MSIGPTHYIKTSSRSSSHLRDNKLLFVNDRKEKCSYWLLPRIWKGPIQVPVLARSFKPDIEIPGDPAYHQVYKHLKRLEEKGYVRLIRGEKTDWSRTQAKREEEIQDSVQAIFRAALGGGGAPPFVSTGAHTGGSKENISTVTVKDPGLTVVPTPNLFYLLSRVQNSNQFQDPAKVRRDMALAKEDLEIKKVQRCRCPYYLSSRTKHYRADAVFKMRSIRRHSYFRRRDQRIVNQELTQDLDYIQGRFEDYREDISDKEIVLIHKENRSIKTIDYQTRFTDEGRKNQTIAKFHRSWGKAGESFNTGVFLTLTSYPPTEAPRSINRSSLWHVNRYYARAWNSYITLLAKRERAARRDELLEAMRSEVQKVRTVREGRERCFHCDSTGRIKTMDRKNPVKKCPHCQGLGYRIRIRLTREERTKALEPMKGKSFRPKYIQVYEFQKNGMIHGHCVIFGKHWLDSFDQIKNDWVRLGQGERIHVYALHQEGGVWKWSRQAPRDSRNRQPIDYLAKYLGKGVRTSGTHGLYWAVNKRFFTNSRALLSDQDLPEILEKLPAQYTFVGTFKGGDLPAWLFQDKPRALTGPRGSFDPLGWHRGPGVPA